MERAPLGDDVTLTLTPQPQTQAHTLQTIYQENIQSIVSIWGDAGTSYSFGTGVVLSADGYIITNTHVIEGCSSVEVVLQDDSSYEALLVGMDVPTDLAVLKMTRRTCILLCSAIPTSCRWGIRWLPSAIPWARSCGAP